MASAWRPALATGDYNLAVRALQVGLTRGLRVYKLPKAQNKQNGAYGHGTVVDVLAFKRHERLVGPDGRLNPNIWGSAAWDNLERFLTDTERGWIAKYHAQLLAAPPVTSVRKKIVDAALRAYANRSHYRYHQIRPMAGNLFSPTAYNRTDCSSLATLCYKAAGAGDPNRRSYDGYGFTGTLWPHGSRVQSPAPGDLAFYGWSSRIGAPSHVAVYIGGGEVISFGSNPIKRLPLRYRSDYQGCRSYF